MVQYKCLDCFLGYIHEEFVSNGKCPVCNSKNLEKHCELDRPCRCAKGIHETVKFCDVCGHVVCPECGCHDVEAISRITGYLNAVEGFNSAKKQELRDRVRYTIE